MFFILKNDVIKQKCIDYTISLDKPTEVRFYEYKSKRSLNQNALWHKWCDYMGKEMGYSPAEMKTALKREILGVEEIVNPLTGEVITKDYSTASLNTEQFSLLMTETQRIANEYEIFLPNYD